ncbi:MAG: hypothetical protein ACE5HR_00380 [bacterium]
MKINQEDIKFVRNQGSGLVGGSVIAKNATDEGLQWLVDLKRKRHEANLKLLEISESIKCWENYLSEKYERV